MAVLIHFNSGNVSCVCARVIDKGIHRNIICVADNDMIASSLRSVKKLGDQFVVTFAMMSHVEAFSGNNVETLVIVIRP